MKKSWLKDWKSGSAFQLTVGAVGVAAAVFANSEVTTAKEKAPAAVPGEIIVGMSRAALQANGVGALDVVAQAQVRSQFRMALFHALGPNSIQTVSGLEMDDSVQKITLSDPSRTKEAITQLKESMGDAVRYAEPNYIYTTQLGKRRKEPTDVDFAKQWDLKNVGQLDRPAEPDARGRVGTAGTPGADINVVPLWKKGFVGDRRMLVAVIDTGIDFNHPDLKANIYTNPKETAGNGIDDDGNGVVDDVHGASFIDGAATGNGMDDNNHGTHCAGTIGASGDDDQGTPGVGITGVNWEVSLLPVKFLTAEGSGSLEDAVNSIKYATKMGAKVMSNSWGGGGYSEALKAAIQESHAAGALFVAAAGNSANNNDDTPSYPASYDVPNVMSVAATDNKDGLASFSCYGKRSVHVAAPGHNILSTVAGGGYDIYSGTSMATPHVSGIAALVWTSRPDLSAVELKQRLIKTSTPIDGLRKKSASRGRVNAWNAYKNIVTPSDDPADNAWKDVAFTAESAHPYADKADQSWEISAPGATHLRVVFERIETETRYDAISLVNDAGETIEAVSGTKSGEYVTDYVKGDRAKLTFKSDDSVNGWGFKISKIQVVR